jgi:hypothetical protein
MPLIVHFDEAIRFRLTAAQKQRLYREAKRRNMSGADLLRSLIDNLPAPRAKARAKRTA